MQNINVDIFSGMRVIAGKYVSRADAAKAVGLKPSTLRTWNSIGRHDGYFSKVKFGNRVYYRCDLLEKFVNDQYVDRT